MKTDNETFLCWTDHQLENSGSNGIYFPTFLVTITIGANMLLLGIMIFNKELRTTRFNKWIISLAILDIIFAVIVQVITTLTRAAENMLWLPFSSSLSKNGDIQHLY
jgi:hypothetical protein